MYRLGVYFLPALSLGVVNTAVAQCDCAATSAAQACQGQQISVSVGNDSRSIELTWEFNSGGTDAQCGQFANGDYWIAPAAGQSTVSLVSLNSQGSGQTYLDENPQMEALGFLDNDYGNEDPTENVLANLPLSYNYSTSLVAAVQRDESRHGGCGTRAILGSCVELYQVLTVLTEVPANAGADLLRPSMDDSTKPLLSLSEFDFSTLPSLDYISAASPEKLESIRQRWSHSSETFSLVSKTDDTYSEGGRAFRANLLVDDYAAGVARAYINDYMTVFSSGNSFAEKRSALAAMLTYGKDIYDAVHDNHVAVRSWGSGAGQHLGKFPPAVFFASFAKNSAYANALRRTSTTMLGTSEDGKAPQELEQINVGANGPVWGDGFDQQGKFEVTRHWAEMWDAQCFDGAQLECRAPSGRKASRDPYGYMDGPPLPGSSYMAVSAGPIRGFAALAHLVPQACSIINYPPMIEYADRLSTFGIITANDPCAPPDPREQKGVCDSFRGRNCEYYGLSNTGVATWGPVSEDRLDECIPNNSGGNTGQRGRFPDRHGAPMNIGYQAPTVEANWNAIVTSTTSCGLILDLLLQDGFE